MLKTLYRYLLPSVIRIKIWEIKNILKWKRKIYIEKIFIGERYPYKSYCDKYKCIFIHIPKNAGTSIITLLNDNVPIEQEHNSYWDYLRSDPVRYYAYETFCVVRNPWERLLSAYQYLKDGGNKGSDKHLSDLINSQCKDFDDFVLNWLSYDKMYNITVLNPQFIYLYDFQNEKITINNILRFEYLSSDFSAIQKKLGIPGNLPWSNRSKHTDYQKYYTDDMVQIVAEFYAFDIKLFNYQFGGQNDS